MQTPSPGSLHVIQSSPNPLGANDAALYLFVGDATSGPITRILPENGIRLPQSHLSLARAVRLKLLHFNDLHGHISCFSPYGHLPVFSRMVSRIRSVRAAAVADDHAAVLVVSGGDEIGGSIFDELLGECPESFVLHAGYRLYSQAGVDAGVPGNHDFDKGTVVLANAIQREARFPILAANVTDSPALVDSFHPAALFYLKGIRVGVIGLATPAQLHPNLRDELTVVDPIETAHNLIPAIRPLCDVLVILSHLGYSLGTQSAIVSMAGDVELAQSLSPEDVQLIIGAHTHNVLNEKGLSAANIVNDIPIVQAGKLGQFIGEVDITVQKTAAVTHVRLTATADLPVDAEFEREHVQPLLELAQPYWDRILGRVADAPDLSTDAVRNEFTTGESALANFITDALAAQSREHDYPVDFAMIDASNVRSGLDVGGVVTFGDWFNLMPFADTLCLFRMTGRQFYALLQDNAMRIDRPIEPHTDRGFLHFSSEIRYAIELGPTRCAARPFDIFVNGQSLAQWLDQTFLVATSSFIREPAGVWESYVRGTLSKPLFDFHQLPQESTHLFVRDLIVEYISAQQGVLPEGGARRDGRLQILSTTTVTA